MCNNYDKFNEIFDKQKEFFNAINKDKEYNIEKLTKEYLLATLVECVEAMDEINWKIWKADKKNIDITKLKYELVDIFTFFIDLCILWDITPNELYDLFMEKYKVNCERYINNKENNNANN